MQTPMELKDFSGGFTDSYLNGPANKCQANDNLVITIDKHLRSRNGSTIYDAANPQLPAGAVRIGTLIPFNKTELLLTHAVKKLYSANVEILGPGGASAFPAAGVTNYVTWGEYKKQIYMTNDAAGSPVQVVYKDGAGVLQLRTAGLPPLATPRNDDSANAFTAGSVILVLVNNIRATMATHFSAFHAGINGSDVNGAALTALANATNEVTFRSNFALLLTYFDLHYRDTKQTYSVAAVATNYVHKKNVNEPLSTYHNPDDRDLIKLSTTTVPIDLVDCYALLLELYKKCNFHFGDTDVHNGFGYYNAASVDADYYASFLVSPGVARFDLANSLLSNAVTKGPVATRNYSRAEQKLQNLRAQFEAHRANQAGAHPTHNVAAYTAYKEPGTFNTEMFFHRNLWDLHKAYWEHLNDSAVLHDALPAPANELTYRSRYDNVGDVHSDLYAAKPHGWFREQIEVLNSIGTKFLAHEADQTPHNNDALSLSADLIDSEVLEVVGYLYALHYYYEYSVGTTPYVVQGPVLEISVSDVLLVDQQALKIVGIPVLANTANTSYDTANIKVKIARTQGNGAAFYYCGEVTNGTTEFLDTMTDDALVTQEPLYIDGGVVDHDPPPVAKAIHILEGNAYYGNITEAGESFPNRVRAALPGLPFAAPGDQFDDLDSEVMAISSAKTRVVAICRQRVYRIEGGFDELGRGQLRHESLSDSIGTDSPQSVVQAGGGVFFAGTDGFYFTDGLSLFRINDDWSATSGTIDPTLPSTYGKITSTTTKKRNIVGSFNAKDGRVYWSAQKDDASGDNDTIFVLDLRFGIRPDSSFSTWSNGADFRPTALLAFNGELLRGDTRGYVFKHQPGLKNDPQVDTGSIFSAWNQKAIVYNYISCASDFGTSQVKKFSPSCEVTLKNNGNVSVQVKSINDDLGTGYAKSLKPIRYRGEYPGMIREIRKMVAGSLRYTYKQLQITNAEIIVTSSDVLGLASINQLLHTATLDSAVTEDWPVDAVGWSIAFLNNAAAGVDNYVHKFPITIRNPDTLTFTDLFMGAPSSHQKWELIGTPKDEVFELIALSIDYEYTGSPENDFNPSGTGANA